MKTQTPLSRHNKFISAEILLLYSPFRQMTLYMLPSCREVANVEFQFLFRR